MGKRKKNGKGPEGGGELKNDKNMKKALMMAYPNSVVLIIVFGKM